MTFPNPALVPPVVAGGVQAAKEVTGLIPGADAAASLIDGVVAVRRWISDRHNWTRVAWFGAGVVLVLTGAAMLARKPIQAAVTAVPVGKAAKAVKAVKG